MKNSINTKTIKFDYREYITYASCMSMDLMSAFFIICESYSEMNSVDFSELPNLNPKIEITPSQNLINVIIDGKTIFTSVDSIYGCKNFKGKLK